MRRLLALAKAIKLAPSLAEKVRSGAVSSESAVQIGRLSVEDAIDLDAAAKANWLVCQRYSMPARRTRFCSSCGTPLIVSSVLAFGPRPTATTNSLPAAISRW